MTNTRLLPTASTSQSTAKAIIFLSCLMVLVGLILVPTGSAQQLTPLVPSNPSDTEKGQDPGETDTSEAMKRLAAAARKMEKSQEFDLKYNFQEGEVLQWESEHAFSTDVRKGPEQSHTTGRALCVMQWQVTDLDSVGQATVVLTLKTAKMWQQEDENEPVEYDSEYSRGDVPPIYQQFDEWVGIPIATYTLDGYGRVRDRKENFRDIKFGMGHVTVPLPSQSIRIGDRWHSDDSIQVRMPEGYVKQIKTRMEYRLREVEDGLAYISVTTQVLTPVRDARVQSQLLQQLSNGVITFDMNRGRMVEKRLDWDEKSIGYAGPESSLKYLAKYHTRLQGEGQATESVSNVWDGKSKFQSRVRLSDDGPVLRW